MGDQPKVIEFTADDSFLRRIDRPRLVRDDGALMSEVFRPRPGERSLSFTLQDEALKTAAGLYQYQLDKRLLYGGFPGLCHLTFHDLTKSLDPSLPPRREPNQDDLQYGHLHCVTDCPRDQLHMEQMAKLATRNGVLRPFKRSPK